MKFNLKTIKEACFIHGCKREVFAEILGLEKELQEHLPTEDEVTIRSMRDNVKTKLALGERRKVIKEILGE